MPETVIRVESLTKVYGDSRAVDGVTFDVFRGEIFALLGSNGAGKTTTVEIMEGYRRPTSGQVTVLGCNPFSEGRTIRPRIGAMLQEGGVYPNLGAREALALFARFYPSPRRPDELLDLVGLQNVQNTPYRRLSGGEKQRLSLALALVGRPELLFLDEPTAGLDPRARRNTWDIMSTLRAEGVTVLLTTHYLDEAEQLTDRVAIIDAGKLLTVDRPASLTRLDARQIRVHTESTIDCEALEALPHAMAVRAIGDNLYAVETDNVPELLVEVTSLFRDSGSLLRELRVGEGSLEDVFLRLTGKEYEA